MLGSHTLTVLQGDGQVVDAGFGHGVVLASVDWRRDIRYFLPDGFKGVCRADLKVHAVEGEVFSGGGARAERPHICWAWLA